MIPELTEDGYEGFDSLAEKTNSWLVNQPPSITVINMQSVMVMMGEGELFYCQKLLAMGVILYHSAFVIYFRDLNLYSISVIK